MEVTNAPAMTMMQTTRTPTSIHCGRVIGRVVVGEHERERRSLADLHRERR